MRNKSLTSGDTIEAIPKKTRQGMGKHTKYSASSRNGAKKRYRGQGRKQMPNTFGYEVGKPRNLQYRSDWDDDNDGNVDTEEREKYNPEESE